jgi:hypothetical protein
MELAMTTNTTTTMRLPLALSACALPLLGGCNGALVGNLFVLCVTFGIFFGTLGLGRSGGSATRSASRDGLGSSSHGASDQSRS